MSLNRGVAITLAVIGGMALATLYLLAGTAFDAVRDGAAPSGAVFAGMVGAGLAGGIAAWAGPLIAGRDAPPEEHRERARIVAQVFALGAVERTRERTGRIVSTATDGVERAAAYRATFLAPMIGSLAVPVAVLAMLAVWVDGVSAGILAIALPAIPVTLGAFQSVFRKVSSRYRASARAASAQFLDAIQGLGTLRLLGAGRDMGRRLAAAAEDVRRHVMRLLAGNQIVLLIVDSAFSLAFVAAAAALALTRYDAGHITAGQGLAMVLCSALLLDPLDRVGQFFYVGMGGLASIREIRAFLAQPPAVSDADDAVAPPASSAHLGGAAPEGALLAFDRVSFAYDPEVPVVDDLTFAIGPGERVALVGPSGVGKTTVAGLAQAMMRPDSGTVRIAGHDARTVPLAWVRAQIAVVAQHTYLFTGTLRDNLRIADPGAPDTRLWEALDLADLAAFVRTLPQGLDTPVGERGLALSGGQAQRLAIARAFLKDAPILILDEPTAHVDLASERAILAALERLAAGRAVVAISHRAATIASAGRIIALTPVGGAAS
jgi:ABC-type multidrug transport system fused ATPase/permease subunit